MSSGWKAEIAAVFGKELRSELRSRSGLATAGLFAIVTVFTLTFASMNTKLDGNIAAGLLWVSVLFSSIVSLPRTFVTEEEQGTGDLLRLWARPHAVYWGKALFNLAQLGVMALLLSFLYLGFTGLELAIPWLYWLTLLAGCAALAGAVTLTGAIVARAASRSSLAGAIAVPILLPIMAAGVGGMRSAFGTGFAESGAMSALGLVGYAVASLAIGPWLFAAVWKS
ncbi:MAG: heme exporter protein CcmB [Fimbriimonas sp.]